MKQDVDQFDQVEHRENEDDNNRFVKFTRRFKKYELIQNLKKLHIIPVHEENFKTDYQDFGRFSFYIKLLLLLLCGSCAGITPKAQQFVNEGSLTVLVIPFISSWSYLMITGVITLSYVLGHKMNDELMFIFHAVGACLFFFAGGTCVSEWRTYHEVTWLHSKSQQTVNTFLSQTILQLACGFSYTFDVVYCAIIKYNLFRYYK